MEIDEKIVKETTYCGKNFECLKDENFTFLKSSVENCVAGKVHFINCNEMSCKYKMNFGYSKICNCPVRKEIFNKYNK